MRFLTLMRRAVNLPFGAITIAAVCFILGPTPPPPMIERSAPSVPLPVPWLTSLIQRRAIHGA